MKIQTVPITSLREDPRYVDVCVARWQNLTKKRARNDTRPDVVME